MPFPLFVLISSLIAIAAVGGSWRLADQRAAAVSAAALGATIILLFHGPIYFGCKADDAFITFRYSKHLAEGLGPNWNNAGRVEGYTSFSWMAILAGLDKLGLDIVETSRWLGLLAVLVTDFFVYRIWRLWQRDESASGLESPVLIAAVFIGLAMTDGTTFWGFSGMETPFFMATLTAGVYLFLRELRGAYLPWSALAFAAAAMTRPEGLIAAGLTGAFILARPLWSGDVTQSLRRFCLFAGVFLALYAPYFVWRYAYYDYLLPNTFYAKAGASTALYERGLTYVWTYGLRYQLLPLLVGTALLLRQARLRDDALYLIALTSAMLLAVVFEGGDAFGHGRFVVPILPLAYLGGLAGFSTILRRLSIHRPGTTAIACVALGLGALSLYPGLHEEIPCRTVDDIQQRRELGEWLTQHAPKDYTIATFAVGALGYYTDRDMLDLLGINDVTIAHTDIPGLGTGLAGHEKYNVDYVFDQAQPEIIVPSDAEPGPITTEELRQRFSIPSPIAARNAYLGDPRLWERYVVRSLNIKGRWYNFLQRKDTVGALQAPELR